MRSTLARCCEVPLCRLRRAIVHHHAPCRRGDAWCHAYHRFSHRRRQPGQLTVYGLAVAERRLWHHRDGVRELAQRVIGCGRIAPVDIGHVDVAHIDVGDVDVTHIGRAARVTGPIEVVVAQRHPTHGRRGTEAEGNVPSRIADKSHQRRCVDRARCDDARRPAPVAVVIHPAAVVERRKAPGRVIHPSPAPRVHPGPAAVAVGGPVDRCGARNPDGAVVRRVLPVTVLVEFLLAGNFGRYVAGGAGIIAARVAGEHPIFERTAAGAADAVLQGIDAVDDQFAAFLDRHLIVFVGQCGGAAECGDHGLIHIAARFESIGAGAV